MESKAIFILTFLAYLHSFFNSFSQNREDTLRLQASEITITSLRYPEKIFEVPLSVTFIDKSKLTGVRGISIEEPLSTIPGVLVQPRAGNQDIRITVRGFGSRGAGNRSNSGTIRGLRFLLDGIPQTEPDGRTSLDFFDLAFVENIEVIRSNSSALWGNSAGAIFDFRTTPNVFSNSLTYQLTIGTWGLKKNVLRLQSNIGTNTGATLNLLHQKFDGWRENSASERLLVNFGFVSKVSDKTSARVNINLAKNFFYIPGAITPVMYDSLPSSANPFYLTNKERRNNKLAQVAFTFEHNLDHKNVFSFQGFLTAKYLQRSERGTYRDFNRFFLGSSASYKNQIEFSYFRNILLFGYENSLQDGSILFYNLDSNAKRSNILRTDKREGASTFGLFLQDEISFENFSIILGSRYDNVTYYSQDFLNKTITDEKKFNRITPKIGLSYQILPNKLSIFGNIGGGIEVPAGNETDPPPGQDTIYQINPLLDPIRSITYELGLKSFMPTPKFIQSIQFLLSAFYIDTRNELIPYKEGRFYFSSGRTSRLGLETNLNLIFPLDINFSASFSFMDHKFIEYQVDSGYYDPSKQGIYKDFKNNKIPGIPNLFYHLSLNIPYIFKFELSAQGVGKYFADDANRYSIPAYTILNSKISFDNIYIDNKLNLSLSFSINNILNNKYIGSAFLNPLLEKGTNLPYYIEPGLPRNFVFSIQAKIY